MLARIEEFDSLTPLIVTPNSLSDDDHAPIQPSAMAARHQSADRVSSATNTTNTPVSFRGSPRRRPRCMGGKVTLFPLASNARRAEPYLAAELAASDSGGDSIRGYIGNNVYTRVPTSAPNGVVMRNPFEDLDLVSIDRVSNLYFSKYLFVYLIFSDLGSLNTGQTRPTSHSERPSRSDSVHGSH